MTQYTNQTAFDAMVARLKDGNGRSVDPVTNKCRYRCPDGNKCVVGVLLNDKDAEEGDALSVGAMGISASYLKDVSNGLMLDMQHLHDEFSNWDGNNFINWEAVRKVGRYYGLDISNVPET